MVTKPLYTPPVIPLDGDVRMTNGDGTWLSKKSIEIIESSLDTIRDILGQAKDAAVETAGTIKDGVVDGTKKTFAREEPVKTSKKELDEEPDCEYYGKDLFDSNKSVCGLNPPSSCRRTKEAGRCRAHQTKDAKGTGNMRPIAEVMADTFQGINEGIGEAFPKKKE